MINALDFDFLLNQNNLSMLAQGLFMTLILAFLAVALGAVIALIPAFMRMSKNKLFQITATTYVEVIRGTPMLVQVLIIYQLMKLPLILFMGIDMGSFIPGLVALVINSSAYISEVIRAGILAVDKGQTEAARSLGMSQKQTMIKIVLPQAINNIIPALGNEFVTIIKETSIFMYLGVAELMFQINIIKSNTFRVTEVYIVAGILYMILTIPLSKVMNMLERKLRYAYAK
jgi:polar amino acid transport system permease protein/polar amino acid transport system substrate-binding protein